MKQVKLVLWIFALCASIIVWLIFDLKLSKIDYGIHSFLIDKKSGELKKPREIMDMTKILNITEKYINETNSIERLYDLQYNLNLENPNVIDQMYSNSEQLKQSSWPSVNQTKCGKQLNWILDELKQIGNNYPLLKGKKGYDFAQLIGSIGKPEAGLFASGATSWIGSYERCSRINMNSSAVKIGDNNNLSSAFKMRYCWYRLRFKWWPKNETVYPATVVRVGACLPETCDTQSSELFPNELEQLVKFNWPQYYIENMEFESMFCLPDERSPIRQLPIGGYYYLFALISWLIVISIASLIYEIQCRKQRKLVNIIKNRTEHFDQQVAKTEAETEVELTYSMQIIDALSIHCSIKRFKSNRFKINYNQMDPNERPRVDLSCFDSFKVGMAILIVLGHGAFMGSALSRSLANRVDMNTGIYGSLTLCIGRCVDTFFIFFGILTSYNIMRKFTIKQLENPLIWLGVNIGILLRISPIFMLIYWYARLISPYTASGPWWDYGVMKHSMRSICMHEPWWKSIPYFGCNANPSISPPISPCNPPAWFIVSYSQVSLILPLITYIIIKLPNRIARLSLIAFLCTISVLQFAIKIANQTTVDGKAFTLYGGFMVDLMEKFESSGQMSTLGRVGCVSIGCYVGYLLRRYELGEIKQWPQWLRSKIVGSLCLLVSVLVCFMPTIGYFILKYSQRAGNLTEVIITNSICIILWPILNAILIICATTIYNHQSYIRFFAHSFWHSFNKLGLCIYLIHWEILTYGLTSYEQGPSYGYVMDVLKLWAYSLIFTILFAFVIHILFEIPLTELLTILSKILMQPNGPRRIKEEEVYEDNQDKKQLAQKEAAAAAAAPQHLDAQQLEKGEKFAHAKHVWHNLFTSPANIVPSDRVIIRLYNKRKESTDIQTSHIF